MQHPSLHAVLLGAFCAVASQVTFAQNSVSFTITGEIEEDICTPTLGGPKVTGSGNSYTVTLEKVGTSQLANATNTAGDTELVFTLTGCNMSNAKDKMWIHFISSNVDPNGRIIPTTGSGNVRFEIRDIDSSGTLGDVVKVATSHSAAGTSPTSGQGGFATLTPYPNRSATKKYNLRYYAEQAVTQAGVVSANAEFLVKYY